MAVTADFDVSEAVEPRQVCVLGSTGSVGCNTLDLISRHNGRYTVEALTANRNVKLLAEQARTFHAGLAVIAEPSLYQDLKDALADTDTDVAAGPEALLEAAQRPADWVMGGIVGAAGLKPTLEAVRRGACIALANKECLVSAGELFLKEVEASGATLLPVDSEHNAIFQVFDFERADTVDRIILTASGGPFRTWTTEEMSKATPQQAVAHPNWDMGAKISVDSATLMNKGLEFIEAFHLFPVGIDNIEIIVHPESVIHSMVGYIDGSVLAQLGSPDMRTPIAYALAWPHRITSPSPKLDLAEVAQLTFETPDEGRFPALRLAREALQSGGGAPTILNAANEVAVESFLQGHIGFLDIALIIERALDRMRGGGGSLKPGSLDDVHELDAEARRVASDLIVGLARN